MFPILLEVRTIGNELKNWLHVDASAIVQWIPIFNTDKGDSKRAMVKAGHNGDSCNKNRAWPTKITTSNLLAVEWPELKEGLQSPPLIAIERLLDSDVFVTLPGFNPATSAAYLAGCRRMRQRRCAPIAPLLFLC